MNCIKLDGDLWFSLPILRHNKSGFALCRIGKKFKYIDRNSAAFLRACFEPCSYAHQQNGAADNELFIINFRLLSHFMIFINGESLSRRLLLTWKSPNARCNTIDDFITFDNSIGALMCENVIEMEVLETLLMYASGSRNPIEVGFVSRAPYARAIDKNAERLSGCARRHENQPVFGLCNDSTWRVMNWFNYFLYCQPMTSEIMDRDKPADNSAT